MAASPVLLVADDLSLIAAVKRVLARESYECVLATNAADAVIAFGHTLPGLVLVQPTVEGDRGAVVLEELQSHPDAQLLRVVLLGDSAPGSSWPIEPVPIDPDHLAKTIATNMRAAEPEWAVREAAPVETDAPPEPAPPGEPDAWRATAPPEVSIEDKLFGDMAADIEASAMESVEAALPQVRNDDELQRLEDDVRAEAQRRRASREARAVAVKPAPPTPPPPPSLPEGDAGETSFADVSDEPPPPPPSRASDVLARAEAMVLESRAQSEAQLRAEEAELHARAAAEETLARRLHDSEQVIASLRQELEAHAAEVLRLNATIDELRVNHDVEVEELRGTAHDADAAHSSQVQQLQRQLGEAQQAHTVELAQLRGWMEEAAAVHEAARTEARATLERVTGELAEARALHGELEAQAAEAATQRHDLQAQLEALRAQLSESGARVETLTADLSNTSELMEETSRERDAIRTRVAALEPELAIEKQRVKELEAREVMPVELPGKRTVGLARHGKVSLDGLSRVVSHVVLANLETRLDLGVEGGVRTLFFKRGQIVAAESNLDHENLLTRARRDGLIDGKQEAELRSFRGATPKEQLDALKARGFIRDIESVPLVQRYTEQVALDAFCEEHSNYRLVDEGPSPATLLATVPRPTLPMLAESLRRAVTPDVLLEKLGGGEAVATPNESELDLRALGFSERERKMLTWVDGEATVEDLSLASGLKPDAAFRALLVAKYLGLIDLKPGTRKTESASGQLDINRLDAKFDEVQDADYFTILGLPRVAGAEDVRRAYQRLAQEFDPLRFSGHPDAGLQQRAQTVSRLLEEAARALEDDRRRAEYARHLLD